MTELTQRKAFDFLTGSWHVRHHRLIRRLCGCTDWQDFDGTCTAWPVLAGSGNLDDNLLHLPGQSYRALTLRSFDPISGDWAIWWLDARKPHQLDVPVTGRFQNQTGTFFANDHLDGKPIRVRFRWLDTDQASPGWEQAFSPDGGQSWEINWTMRFTRND